MPPTTHRRKITQKELKAPDEFTTFVDSARDFLVNNLTQVLVSTAVVVAAGAIVIGVYYYERHRDTVAAAQFYDAITALNAGQNKQAETQFKQLADEEPGAGLDASRVFTSRAHTLPTATCLTRATRSSRFWPRSATRCFAASG